MQRSNELEEDIVADQLTARLMSRDFGLKFNKGLSAC
jgi:hypothetical protein